MATVAKTKQNVDDMTRQERLWDSLNHSYGQQREDIGRTYDKAYSQADRQALSRGMQRSSYNAQNLANINQQRANALDQNWQNQIADYENRLTQQEQLDAENDRWERQFAETQKQNEWSRGFQQQQADTANQQWQMNFNAGREDASWNKDFQREQFAANRGDVAWNQGMQERQFAANQDQNAWQRNMTERQYADSRSDTAWNQNFQQRQFDANQQNAAWQRDMSERQYADNRADTAWQQGMTERQYADNRSDNAWQRGMQERQYADSRSDTAWNQAFQQGQADRSADQWERSFSQSNDSADRQLAASYVASIVAQGGTPSDELLARAGLSRADAEAMKKGSSGSGSGNGNGNGNGDNTPLPGNGDDLFSGDELNGNNGSGLTQMSDDLKNRLSSIASFVASGLSSNNTSSTTTGARNPNAERSFSAAFVDPNDPIIIDPIEEAFSGPRIQTVANPTAVYRTPIDDRVQSSQERLSGGRKRDKKSSNETWSAYH